MCCTNENSSTKISFLINDFFVSAGGILVNETEQKVLIVKEVTTSEYLLPKGTKEECESIEETAVREVYEETGFLNELTKPAKLLAVQIRPQVNGSKGQHKVIYWFYNRLVCDHKHEGTQEDYENFQSEWHTFENAMRVLTYDEDKRLVQYAFENAGISTLSHELVGTVKPNSLLESAKSTGTIRIMLLDDELIRSFAFVILDKSKENVLLYFDGNDSCSLIGDDLPINLHEVRQQKLSIQKPFGFQLIAQDMDNICKIVEWYTVLMNKQNSSLAEQRLKWFPVSGALKLLANKDELNVLKLAMKAI